LAAITLYALDGEEVVLAKATDQWQLVNFGYMFCPDICPINLRLMSELKQEWDTENKSASFAITHITFDPTRDTSDRLSKYLDYINPDYIGLSGELENIRKVAQQLNTIFIHEKPDEFGNYFVTHSDSIAVLNPAGEYVGLFKGPYNKDNMSKALERLIN
jgi:protein SCO1/2